MHNLAIIAVILGVLGFAIFIWQALQLPRAQRSLKNVFNIYGSWLINPSSWLFIVSLILVFYVYWNR
ncbi:hypothetical protein [Loigolactobacillus zhaoyuanensis]|uniref:Uncharacterized protein n=1 Tax=Loigolactobacillus zhaoyuanensis TaxID=2486017 RepID=A0ABW8UEH3_9LACO|nr:hypothetical protein [Loigolactobacillus zhaoyuanensis]